MSIQRMRTRFAKQLRIALYVLIGAFVIGLPLVFVPGSSFYPRQEGEDKTQSAAEAVARVDNQPVMKPEVDGIFAACWDSFCRSTRRWDRA